MKKLLLVLALLVARSSVPAESGLAADKLGGGGRRGGNAHKPYYDPPTFIGSQYPYSEANPPASEYTSDAALGHYWSDKNP